MYCRQNSGGEPQTAGRSMNWREIAGGEVAGRRRLGQQMDMPFVGAALSRLSLPDAKIVIRGRLEDEGDFGAGFRGLGVFADRRDDSAPAIEGRRRTDGID